MKAKLTIGFCALAVTALAVTNIVVTISLPEPKYTNLLDVAAKSGETIEGYVSNKVVRDIEDERLSTLLILWQAATLQRQENALKALRGEP